MEQYLEYAKTLLFYLLISAFSVFFIFKASKTKDKLSKASLDTEKKSLRRKRIIYLASSMLPLLLLIGLRSSSVGTDTITYQNAFERIADGNIAESDSDWLSVGYIFICKVISFFFGKNILFFNLIITFLSLLFMYLAICKNSKNEPLSLSILICTCLIFQMMNQSRQLLAIAIILYATTFIIKKDFWKYLFFVLIAFSIHKSALIMLPFYWLSKINIKKSTYVAYSLLAITLFCIAPLIKDFLVENTYYGYIYEKNQFFESHTSSLIIFVARLAVLVFCIFLSRKTTKDYKGSSEYKTLMNLTIWSTLIQILTIRFYVFGRVATYFYISICLLIPNLLIQNTKIDKKNLYTIIILFWVIYCVGYFLTTCEQSGIGKYYILNNSMES